MEIVKVISPTKSNEPILNSHVVTPIESKMDGVEINISEDKSKSNNGQSNHPGKKDFSKELLDTEIEKLNKVMFGTDKHFEFSVHDKINAVMIKVVDTETKEVIKELPPEKILDLVAKMEEMVGMLVDEKG